jgi:hypothetical protein
LYCEKISRLCEFENTMGNGNIIQSIVIQIFILIVSI